MREINEMLIFSPLTNYFPETHTQQSVGLAFSIGMRTIIQRQKKEPRSYYLDSPLVFLHCFDFFLHVDELALTVVEFILQERHFL